MTKDQISAWVSFKEVVENFLGNNQSQNDKVLVGKLVKTYEKKPEVAFSSFTFRLLSK